MMNFKNVFLAIFMIMALNVANAQSYVQIGNGTESSSMPYTAWYYSWSKGIYQSDNLGEAKTIDALAFQVNTFASTLNNQKIYLKQTSSTSVSGTYEDPTTSGYTLVFDGNIVSAGEATGEWIDLDFTTSFDYNGTDNLIVYMTNEHGASMYNNFYATTATANDIMVAGNDDAFPTSNGFNPYPVALPNVRFYYASSGPATPGNPAPGENAKYVDAETPLEFDLDATTTSYDLYFSNVEADVVNMEASAKITDAAPATGAGTYSVDPTPADELLNSRSIYFWRVVVSDGSSTSTSPVWAFRTQRILNQFPYVQNFEGGDDVVFTPMYMPSFSEWDWTVSTGSWDAVEMNPQSGDSCAYVSPTFLEQDVDYELRTPRFDLPANTQVSFWWKNGDVVDKTAGVDSTFFQITTDGGNNWETLAVLSPETQQADYSQVLMSLAGYESNNTYFRWVYRIHDENSTPKNLFLDNIEIKVISNNPEISLNVTSLDFDNIAIGGYNEMDVVIMNNNISNDLIITGLTLPVGYSSDFAATIAGGASATATIRFTPTEATVYNGTATFNVDGDFDGNNTVALAGLGAALQANVYEYFDATAIDAIPTGWRKIEDAEDQFHFVKVAHGVIGEYNSSPNVLRMYNNDEYTYPLMAILPGVSGFDTHELSFYAVKSSMDSVALLVGVMENPFDAETFQVVDTIVVQNEIQQYTVDFEATNTKPYIAFRHAQVIDITASIRIDDVLWRDPNATTVPAAAGNVYPIDGASDIDIMNGVMFKWSNQGGEPTGYRLYAGTNDEVNNLIDGLELGDVTSYFAELELPYGTEYSWKVVAFNANGDAENNATWTFTTMQDPTIVSLPYLEDFNSYIAHSTPGGTFRYPLGWSLENNLSQYYCWDKLSNNANNPENAYSDSVAMHLVGFSFTDPMDDWLFTPPMQLEAGVTYQFSFYYKTSAFPGEETVEKLEVLMGTDNNSEAMTGTSLFYDDNITVRSYTQHASSFQVDESGVYYMGFHGFSDPYQWIMHIDDVQVQELTTYDVTFNVTGDGQPLEGATVNVGGQSLTTNADGVAVAELANGSYVYEVIASGFGTAVEMISVSGEQTINVNLTDIVAEQNIDFNIYPNPGKGVFNISGQGEYNVEVVNAVGQVVLSQTMNGNGSIDLTNRASSVYFVRIESYGEVSVHKLIVE